MNVEHRMTEQLSNALEVIKNQNTVMEQLKQELSKAREDSKRLDWLSLDNIPGNELRQVLPSYDILRQAIDAAMQSEQSRDISMGKGEG